MHYIRFVCVRNIAMWKKLGSPVGDLILNPDLGHFYRT